MEAFLPFLTAGLGVTSNVLGIIGQNKSANFMVSQIKKNNALIASDTQRQLQRIDEQLGMMLSEADLESVKAEARLKAGAAESGVSGRSVQEVQAQVFMDNALDDAVMIQQAQATSVDVARSNIDRALSGANQIGQIRQQVASPFEAILSTVSAAVGGYGSGLALSGGATPNAKTTAK